MNTYNLNSPSGKIKDIINSPNNNPFSPGPETNKKLLLNQDSKEIEDEGEFNDYNNITGLRLTNENLYGSNSPRNKLNKYNDVVPELPSNALNIILNNNNISKNNEPIENT